MLKNLHPDKALEVILENAHSLRLKLGDETISLENALGRAASRKMISEIDHPPFAKSAMDGFAYRTADQQTIYRVVESVQAGSFSDASLHDDEVVRIMTGAPIPEGAAGVQRVEWTTDAGKDEQGRSLVRFSLKEKINNIIEAGENLKKGELLLTPRMLQPQDIGILAAGGCARIDVAKQPRVCVVSTGNEIMAAGQKLAKARIYDSNGPQLTAQARQAGADAHFLGIVPDERSALLAVLIKALAEYDILVLSGGVSMGDFDLVPSVLQELGVEPIFHNLAMRPGKPTFFGKTDTCAVFGLPGNPVSTFVNFEVLVKPFIHACMGIEYKPRMARARLARELARKGSDRVEFLPGILEADEFGLHASPLPYHGSSMITVLERADILFRMELGQSSIPEGAIVDVRLIRP